MAGPNFNDPAYGMPSAGILGNVATTPASGGGIFGGDIGAAGGIGAWFRQNPQSIMALASGLLSGRSPQESMALAAQGYGAAAPAERARNATVDWLTSGQTVDPKFRDMLMKNPTLAEAYAQAKIVPHQLVPLAPGSQLADPFTGKIAGGAAVGRGDNSNYDLKAAGDSYDQQYGTAANRDANAPDFQWWYQNQWPQFGQGAAAAPGSMAPTRGRSDADIRRNLMAAKAISGPYIDHPIYKLVANGAPYLARIDVAAQTPGSAADQEILDSATKLATGGGQITDSQVNTILHGSSFWDKLNVYEKQLQSGGVLSNDQKQQIKTLAHNVFAEYQKQYQPIYDAAMSEMDKAGIPKDFRGVMPDLNALSRAAGVAGGNGEAPLPGDNGLPANPSASGITHTWDPQNGLQPVQ